MTNYPVGDFLIRIKNAALARKKLVVVDKSRLLVAVAEALQRMGYLDKVMAKDQKLEVGLTYKHKEPLLSNLKLVSRPGLRLYRRADFFEKYRGPESFLLSSPKGVISSKEAVKNRIGGEVIAEIL